MNIFDGLNNLRASSGSKHHFIDGPINKREMRSGSLYIPPRISKRVLEKSEKFGFEAAQSKKLAYVRAQKTSAW